MCHRFAMTVLGASWRVTSMRICWKAEVETQVHRQQEQKTRCPIKLNQELQTFVYIPFHFLIACPDCKPIVWHHPQSGWVFIPHFADLLPIISENIPQTHPLCAFLTCWPFLIQSNWYITNDNEVDILQLMATSKHQN